MSVSSFCFCFVDQHVLKKCREFIAKQKISDIIKPDPEGDL